MALLTVPSLLLKGLPFTYVLGKTDLAALITGDAYFADSTNWKKVVVHFKSTTGTEKEKLIFDATQASPQAAFEISTTALNNFVIDHIVVYDFDGGFKHINGNFASYNVNLVKLIAPAAGVTAISGNTVNIDDTSKYFKGFKVRLYDVGTDSYVGAIHEILSISGSTVTLDGNFGASYVAGKYYLRFAQFADCPAAQRANFYFVQ